MSMTNETRAQETLLTRSEVARILGVSPTTVTRWAREGRLPCRRTLGGHHRYASGVIEQILVQISPKGAFAPAGKPAKALAEMH